MKNRKLKLLLIISLTLVVFSIPSWVLAAILYLTPSVQTVHQDDSFLVEVRLDTENEEINAVEISLVSPANLLKVVDFNKGNSILTLWINEPKIQEGEITFLGGIPRGFKGDGLLGKVIFEGKEIGEARINFKEDSMVLLNDGLGTPAKLNFAEGNYEIVKKPEGLPQISSKSHPDQNKWYKSTTLDLYWELIEGAEYSYQLSFDPLSEPDKTSDQPEPKEGATFWMGAMEYDLKEQGGGIYYFSLRQKLPNQDWSEEVSRFRAMIDTTSPEEFTPEIGKDITVFEGKYFLSFATQDETSGVDYYQIKELRRTLFGLKITEKADWKMGDSPYLLEDQGLQSKILVRAVDKAGNEKIVEIVPPYKKTWKDIAIIILIILIGIGLIWLSIRRFIKKKNTKSI